MKIKKVVIPAAGYGTRFLPYTKAVAKEMVPLINRPVIDYVVSEAVASGIEEILIITSSHKNTLLRYFDSNPDLVRTLQVKEKDKLLDLVMKTTANRQINFTFQYEQKGLGHALLSAEKFVNNESFAVLLGDDVVFNDGITSLTQCIKTFKLVNAPVIGVQSVAKGNLSKYGVLKINHGHGQKLPHNVHLIQKLVEKPSELSGLSDLAILGRYILPPDIFDFIKKTEPGVGGEIQITDALNHYMVNNPLYACNFTGLRFDIGNPQGMLSANVYLGLQNDEYRQTILDTIKLYESCQEK